MKKLLFVALFFAAALNVQAQTELKINPLGILFSNPELSAEFAVNEHIGIEPSFGISYLKLTIDNDVFKSSGFSYGVNGKYYFSPESGIDKFYAGIYLRGGASSFKGTGASAGDNLKRNRLGGGLSFGYKWVSSQNIVFDLGTGIGRKVFDKYTLDGGNTNTANIPLLNIDFYIRFGVGYRFGGGSKR